MTTENTTETTVTLTAAQKAEEFFKSHSSTEIIDTLTRCYEQQANHSEMLERKERQISDYRTRWASMSDTIENFLKTHISEKDSASVEELKDLADELEIELTKTMRVTFKIEAEYEIVVPLDTEEDEISEDDFEYSVSFRNTKDEWEENSESYEIADFEVEEQ